MKKYILFDLDGTLTDPREGITTCVQYALRDAGIEENDLEKLEPFIGPPLKDSFMNFYHMNSEEADRAIAKYRERFQDKGIFENELYGGIHDLLRTLKANGMHLAVASSKPTVYVERILKHFKIDKYFEVVVGSELDGTRVTKSEVVLEVLRKFFGDKPIRYDEVYMVGDRRFDVEGARTFHIESVGVTYGYGSMEELKEAKADYIVRSVAELKKFLMREAEEGRRQQEAEKSAQNPQPGRSQTRILWKMLIPFLMFILVKSLVLSVCQTILLVITDRNPDLKSLFFLQGGEEGAVIFNGNSSVALQAIAYAVAAWSIWKYAKPAISKTEDEMKLSHLKKEPVKNYVLMGVVTAGVALGLNIFLSLTGAVERSESYQAVAANQYSADFFPGLLCFGLVAPIAEELIFRGVVYCCLRRAMKPGLAIILSGCMFAAYHGNSVQGLYSFAMGYLLAYGFEYFGRFYVPAVMHIAANVLVYCLSYTALSETAFVSWPVCAVCLAAAGISAFWMNKERNIFK